MEDERHFLLQCPTYADIRMKYNIDRGLQLDEVLGDGVDLTYIAELMERRSSLHRS